MEKIINSVIEALARKAQVAASHEALHYTQAALNLAHVLQVIQQTSE